MEAILKMSKSCDKEKLNEISKLYKEVSEKTIIANFNQIARDFFKYMISIAKDDTKNDLSKFSSMFSTAINLNTKCPIDKFTLYVLPFADKIYNKNIDYFMDVEIKDTEVKEQGEFSIIRSEPFKKLWITLSKEQQDNIMVRMIKITTCCHVFFMHALYKK